MKKLINIFLMLAVMLVFTPVAYGAASNVLTLSAGSQVLLDGKTFSITGSVDEIIAYSNYCCFKLFTRYCLLFF